MAVEARREGIGPRGDRTTSGFVASPQPGSAVAFRRRGISRRKWDAAGVSGGRGRGRGCLGTCGSHRGCPVRGDSGPQHRARRLLQSPAPGSARARPRVCTGCRLLPHTCPIAFKGLALVALAVVTGQPRKGVLRPPALRARGRSPGRSRVPGHTRAAHVAQCGHVLPPGLGSSSRLHLDPRLRAALLSTPGSSPEQGAQPSAARCRLPNHERVAPVARRPLAALPPHLSLHLLAPCKPALRGQPNALPQEKRDRVSDSWQARG